MTARQDAAFAANRLLSHMRHNGAQHNMESLASHYELDWVISKEDKGWDVVWRYPHTGELHVIIRLGHNKREIVEKCDMVRAVLYTLRGEH